MEQFTKQEFYKLLDNKKYDFVNEQKEPLLILALKNIANFNISQNCINILLKNSDLNATNASGDNALLFYFRKNCYDYLFNNNLISENNLSYLIKNTDLNRKNPVSGVTPLLFLLASNKSFGINISRENLEYMVLNSDLKIADYDGFSPLMLALQNNESEDLKLNKNLFDYLLKNSDLNQKTKNGDLALTIYFENHIEQNLIFNKSQVDLLIGGTDYKKANDYGIFPLVIFLKNKVCQDLRLTKKQVDLLIENNGLTSSSTFLTSSGTFLESYAESVLSLFLKNNKEDGGFQFTREQISKIISRNIFENNDRLTEKILLGCIGDNPGVEVFHRDQILVNSYLENFDVKNPLISFVVSMVLLDQSTFSEEALYQSFKRFDFEKLINSKMVDNDVKKYIKVFLDKKEVQNKVLNINKNKRSFQKI
jgi:archaellum component FlaG (FlaF/FlaG flagellin family)